MTYAFLLALLIGSLAIFLAMLVFAYVQRVRFYRDFLNRRAVRRSMMIGPEPRRSWRDEY